MQRILIHNDNGRRDLLGLKLLERALIQKGFKVYFAGRTALTARLRRIRPHALIAARGDNPVAEKASSLCAVYIVPGEGGRTTKETTLSVFLGRGYSALRSAGWIRRCYLWNENTRRWLLETGMLEPAQMKVVGNPRLDIYRCRHFKRTAREPITGRPLRIGIAFSATSTSAYYGHLHFPKVYHDTVKRDYVFPIVPPGRHMEDIVWRDHSILRHMMHSIKEIAERTDAEMILRPNPLEGIAEYRFLTKRYPGRFHLQFKEPLPDFLSRIDVLLTCWSTTGIEALLNDIPVISISGLMDQDRLFDHIARVPSGFDAYVKHYHAPKNTDELIGLLHLAQRGELSTSPSTPADVAKMMDEVYGWTAGAAGTCALIAEDIARDLGESPQVATSREAWNEALPMRYRLPPALAEAAMRVRDLARALRSGQFRSYMSFLRSSDAHVDRLIRRAC
jgi:surface carbohydrate biosynthesis protein